MRVLYAGDSPVGGAANYLLGVLASFKAEVTHIPPERKMTERILAKDYHVIILSDYSFKNISRRVEIKLADKVKKGTGLLMVGGWGSFSGPFGGWKGSLIEQLLPVDCLDDDDRLNFPGGASIGKFRSHRSIRSIDLSYAPAICGMNRVLPKKKSKVVLHVRKILSNGERIRLDKVCYPLLTVSSDASVKTAAFSCDFAPHWCGGLVDWGKVTLRLPVNSKISIQVGDFYVRLIREILEWLAS